MPSICPIANVFKILLSLPLPYDIDQFIPHCRQHIWEHQINCTFNPCLCILNPLKSLRKFFGKISTITISCSWNMTSTASWTAFISFKISLFETIFLWTIESRASCGGKTYLWADFYILNVWLNITTYPWSTTL